MSDSGSLADRVFVALRDDLMWGRLRPTDRLAENTLAERYQVSRTPVREALARLLSDGLIERRDRGFYPYRPRVDDLEDLYELRITLELRGIQRLEDADGRRHDPSILEPELERWREFRKTPPVPDAGIVKEDEQFHLRLLSSSGNEALVTALESVNARIRPMRMFDYLTEDRVLATIDEHIDITERVLDGDLRDARGLLHAHIEGSRRVVIARAREAMAMFDVVMALRD
ncbi:HTH-type transcriptional regulator LutR [Mycolicibacterium vanbaalenii]|uniref:HTH-type transcriptional regulator LutR n=1 Tax=Mycolicibacterium vanbaalenii TaxID=110539 RepID=A0A5S9R9V4_MYCVN|nr:GntR family transcriptional regulator [Mycolicibacterium vanbaalenii]CAA0134981.1 HTH-type transcriptional regulator LutR [Mycolicibacterium vanbaalenii]